MHYFTLMSKIKIMLTCLLFVVLCHKDFENEYKDFKVWNVDFECRLASLLCSALKDCSGLESAFKVSKTG